MKGPEVIEFPRSIGAGGRPRRIAQSFRFVSTYLTYIDEISKSQGFKNRRETLEFCIANTRKSLRKDSLSFEIDSPFGIIRLAGWTQPDGISISIEGLGSTRMSPANKRDLLLSCQEAIRSRLDRKKRRRAL